ncbi:MAG: hypothetical protein WC916_04725 [Candidatus Woesearchaeota archaeon]
MSSKYEFRIECGKSWRSYKKFLKETVPIVLEACKGSDLEERVTAFYSSALPRQWENSINFLSRNESLSYQNESEYHDTNLVVNRIMAKICYYTGKVPLLRKVMRLGTLSTELYLGQDINTKPMAYISNEETTHKEGFGNDCISTTITDFNRIPNFDIDVGFTDGGKNYFFKINAHTDSALVVAKKVYQGIKANFDQKRRNYAETQSENRAVLQLFQNR